MRHILVVDDDTRLRSLLLKYLSEAGFAVSEAKDASEAEEKMRFFIFDLLILDVMMPGQNGIEFAHDLRKISKVPILMLTAMGEVDDRIKGLESGVDDYLTKPFEPKELLLRINNILARAGNFNAAGESNDQIVKFGDFGFNLRLLQLKKSGEIIYLTDAEAAILNIFCRNLNVNLSRQRLAELCGKIDERSIDVQITRLRKKIESDPRRPFHLQTVRNVGYIMKK